MSPQHIPHGLVQSDLLCRLKAAIEVAGLAWIVLSGTTIGYEKGFEPMPDVVAFDPTMVSDQQGVLPAIATKLVIEVAVSMLADDMGEKREEYAEAGLSEYWVADVKARTVIRHAQPVGSGFSRVEAPVALAGPLVMLTRLEIALPV